MVLPACVGSFSRSAFVDSRPLMVPSCPTHRIGPFDFRADHLRQHRATLLNQKQGCLRVRGGQPANWIPSEYFQMPAGTKLTFLLNIILFVVGTVSPDLPWVGSQDVTAKLGLDNSITQLPFPENMIQGYRLFTSHWVHTDAIQLIANVLAMIPIAGRLENIAGTMPFLGMVFKLLLAQSAFSLLFSAADSRPRESAATGFTGVLFGMFAVHALNMPEGSWVNVLGINLPIRLYPLALLLGLRLLNPQLPIMDYVAGLTAGATYFFGALNWIMIPPPVVRAVDNVMRSVGGYVSSGLTSLTRRWPPWTFSGPGL